MSRYVAEGYWVTGYAVGDEAAVEATNNKGLGAAGHGGVISQPRYVPEEKKKKKKPKQAKVKPVREKHVALVPDKPEPKTVIAQAPDTALIERQAQEWQESQERQKALEANYQALWEAELERRREIKALEQLIEAEKARRIKMAKRREEERIAIELLLGVST